MHASDVIDLPELAARQGWTIAAAREIVRRSARRRADGLHARPSDPPPPLRLVAGKSPIWDRHTIEQWEWMREEARIESAARAPIRGALQAVPGTDARPLQPHRWPPRVRHMRRPRPPAGG